MSNLQTSKILTVPRGTVGAPDLKLEMSSIYDAEQRLAEVRTVTQVTQKDLEGLFNEAANLASKYLAWIEYEILQTEKRFALDKATVILEKAPEEFRKLKDTGIKYNEDFREALVAKDEACQATLDILNHLKAVKALLESKSESFIRAHYSSRAIADTKSATPVPNFNGTIGQTYEQQQNNFMGKRRE